MGSRLGEGRAWQEGTKGIGKTNRDWGAVMPGRKDCHSTGVREEKGIEWWREGFLSSGSQRK